MRLPQTETTMRLELNPADYVGDVAERRYTIINWRRLTRLIGEELVGAE